MRPWRQFDPDEVARAHLATGYDHSHNAGLTDQVAIFVAVQGGGHQPGLDPVQLGARVTQSGYLDDRAVAEMQSCAGR